MEKKQITVVKVWQLILNPMRSNTEAGTIVAIAPSPEELIEYAKGELAEEPYISVGDNYFPAKGDMPENVMKGHQFHHVFKRSGNLQWYNPLMNWDVHEAARSSYGHGTHFEWIDEDGFIRYKMNNPDVKFINCEG